MVQGLVPILAVAVLAVGAAAGLVATVDAPTREGTADVSHAVHAKFDVECATCHTGVETSARAGVPSIEVCAGCHDGPEDSIARTENGRRILDHVARKEEPLWPDLYALADHVVFSHKRHVAIGRIPCTACHGDIGTSTTLQSEGMKETTTMEGCVECHERLGASRDCCACHR